MSRRWIPCFVLTLGLVASSCSSGRELTVSSEAAAPTPKPAAVTDTSESAGPDWYLAGVKLARADLLGASPLERATLSAPPTTVVGDGVPSRDEILASLAGLGIEGDAAACIARNLSTPEVAQDGQALLRLVGASAPGADPTASAEALSAVQQLDEGTTRRLIVALSPCLDTNTLLTLLAGSGSLGGVGGLSALAGTGLTSLLASTSVSGLNASQLAGVAGTNLSSNQLAALTTFLAGISQGRVGGLDVNTFDISKLDLENLSPEQLILLLAALSRGLSPDQSTQLTSLAGVDLGRLGLNIDTSKLTTQEAGALLVLFLPFLGSGLQPAGQSPPPGGDPNQLFVPAGQDLSNINPLLFVPRENLILGLNQSGVSTPVAGCLYDRLRVVNPQLIALAFAGTDLTATGQILLATFQCLVGVTPP